MNQCTILFCIATAILFSHQSTHATPVLTEWGTEVLTSTRLGTIVNFGPNAGGRLVDYAYSSINNTTGNGQAEVTLAADGSINIPTLKAEAYSTSSGQAQARATGIEGYTYTGAAAKTFTLTSTLTADVSDPEDGFTGVEADVVVFQAEGFEFFTDLPTLIFELGATPVDDIELSVDDTEMNALRMGQLTFTLEPGESVYLFAQLFAQGRNQGYADAFATLTNVFDDSTGLVAASDPTPPIVPVPEPGVTILTLLSAAAMLRRRQTQSRDR